MPDTFIFPSVTLANIGLLPAITQPGDLLVVDRESHDSVHQGAKLAAAAGARLEVLATPEPQALEKLVPDDLLQAIASRTKAAMGQSSNGARP